MKRGLNLIYVNQCLVQTVEHDKGLTESGKQFFRELAAGDEFTVCAANKVAELVRRNYITIEGFPSTLPVEGADRRSLTTRIKEFFTKKGKQNS